MLRNANKLKTGQEVLKVIVRLPDSQDFLIESVWDHMKRKGPKAA